METWLVVNVTTGLKISETVLWRIIGFLTVDVTVVVTPFCCLVPVVTSCSTFVETYTSLSLVLNVNGSKMLVSFTIGILTVDLSKLSRCSLVPWTVLFVTISVILVWGLYGIGIVVFSMRRVSHVLPIKPDLHVQVKFPTPSTHIPPFWHGSNKHSRISR